MVVGKGLAALLTFKWLYTRMGSLMFHHVRFLEERLVAVGALELAIPVVDPQMGNQMLVLYESLAAELTFKGSLFLVQTAMQLKARVFGKGLWAVGTLIGSFASVPLYMGPKIASRVKGFVALWTFVTLFLVVGVHMRLQSRTVRISFRAEGAFKRTLSSMTASMGR